MTVTGPGEMAALGSGRPCTEESYHAGTHSTFDGRALAAIRATGPGEIRVHAVTASGLTATTVVRASLAGQLVVR